MKLTSTDISAIFDGFNALNILIIGDVMIDAYYWGKVDRISPEAPVPIVSVQKKESRLGGAANVALNVQSLGANPILCSVIGEDEEAREFQYLLKKAELSGVGIIKSRHRRTTQKTRVISDNHQMLRIDGEDIHALLEEEERAFISKIEKLINSQEIDAIIFEDYDKGIITPTIIEAVVKLAEQKNIPTTVDPKKRNFNQYQKVTLFKPNLKELKEGLKIDFDHIDQAQLEESIDQLEAILGNKYTLITLSESGVFINSPQEKHHISAHRRDIADVSGAGDTVISVATLCLALNQNPEFIAELSNLAGGLVCENVGVVPIDKSELMYEANRLFT